MQRILIRTLLSAMLIPSQLRAETTISLPEAVGRALKNNHQIRAAAAEKREASADLAISRGTFFPRLTAEEGFAASDSPTRTFMMKLDQGRFTQNDFLIANLNHPRTATDFRSSISLEQPLFDASLIHGLRMARADVEAGDAIFDLRREQVALEVISAYLAVQKAKGHLLDADKGVEAAREHLKTAAARNTAGTGLRSDELRARSFLSETEERRIVAANDLTLAKLRLGLAMGAEPGSAFDVAPAAAAASPSRSADELVKLALENRRDLAAAGKRREKAELATGLAKSAYLPTLYADASYQMNHHDTPFARDNDAWSAGVMLRWDLFDGLRRENTLEKARAEMSRADELIEQQRSEVDFQVREAFLRREEAEKRVEVARNRLTDAEEGLRLIEKRFANALATIVELLDAQTAVNRARADLADNESDSVLAAARLSYAAGTLSREILQ